MSGWRTELGLVGALKVRKGVSGTLHPHTDRTERCRAWGMESTQTLLLEVGTDKEDLMRRSCSRFDCGRTFTGQEQYMVAQLAEALDGLENPEEDPRRKAVRLGRASSMLEAARTYTSVNAPHDRWVSALMHAMTDRLERDLAHVLQEMRTPTLRQELLEALTHYENVPQLMVEHGYTPDNTHTPGLLVGPLQVRRLGQKGIVLALCDQDGPVRCIQAPLGALLWLVDQADPEVSGNAPDQVVVAPEDLTPDLLETIMGLYQPGSTEAMGDLSCVVETARALHKQD